MSDKDSIQDVLSGLNNALNLLREFFSGDSVSWSDEEFKSRFNQFVEDIVSDKPRSERYKALNGFKDFVLHRFAFKGNDIDKDIIKDFRGIYNEIKRPKKAHKRILSEKIQELREGLRGTEKSTLADVQEILENCRSSLLTLVEKEKSSTLNTALEDLESCFNSLAGEPNINRAIEDLVSCKSQLKRFMYNLPPSGIVPLTGDPMTLYRALRNAGKEGLTKKQGMDLLDCSESHFFDCLRDIRETGVRIDVEGEGSAERSYIYRGR